MRLTDASVGLCSERGTMAPYADRIREEVPGIEVTVSASDRDPYNIV